MVIVTSSPHKRKNFSENYPEFEYSPALSYGDEIQRKSFGVEAKLSDCPGRLHVFGWSCQELACSYAFACS
jgi:hypothetical protein